MFTSALQQKLQSILGAENYLKKTNKKNEEIGKKPISSFEFHGFFFL